MMINLDAASGRPLKREVLQAMWPDLSGVNANPSTLSNAGIAAANRLEQARLSILSTLGATPEFWNMVFTSGATESVNTALVGVIMAYREEERRKGRREDEWDARIITTDIEHSSILNTCDFLSRCMGVQTEIIPVSHTGQINYAALKASLEKPTTIAAFSLANSEVGTIQDGQSIVQLCSQASVPILFDITQAVGQVSVSIDDLGADIIALSAHKLGGPRSVGGLIVRNGITIEPLIHGGGQENGMRSGTEDLAGAVGFAVALRLAVDECAKNGERWKNDRNHFIERVLAGIPTAELTGHPHNRLSRHASFVIPGITGETLLVDLEAKGIVCGAGSACRAKKAGPSPVLLALGVEKNSARGAIRFSWGDDVGEQELDRAAENLVEIVKTELEYK